MKTRRRILGRRRFPTNDKALLLVTSCPSRQSQRLPLIQPYWRGGEYPVILADAKKQEQRRRLLKQRAAQQRRLENDAAADDCYEQATAPIGWAMHPRQRDTPVKPLASIPPTLPPRPC